MATTERAKEAATAAKQLSLKSMMKGRCDGYQEKKKVLNESVVIDS